MADERPAFQEPDWFSRRVFNPLVAWLARRGLSLAGSAVLRVRGRSSGEWRETPVNPLTLDGARYLVAARGETQWVRNMRAAHGGELRVGRRREAFSAVEVLDDAAKLAVLRAYLRRWKWEVGAFFGGVGPDSSDEELVAEGRRHPVFRIEREEPG